MSAEVLRFDEPVTLVGGGALDRRMLDEGLACAPVLIAGDGAADRLAAWGLGPRAVIGDMDSLSDLAAWQARTKLIHLPEQETTDFEKCLYSVDAPYFVAAGFTGGRMDHTLAAFHVLLRRPEKKVFLIGETEAIALLPARREVGLDVGEGAIVSLFPLTAVRGVLSTGLEWPIDGLDLAVGQRIGTSNRAKADQIRLAVDGPGVLICVPRSRLGALIDGIAAR